MTKTAYILKMYPTPYDVNQSLQTAKKQLIEQLTKDTYKDNLRHRTPSVSFDSKFRGALGENLMLSFFNNTDIKAQTLNSISDSNGDVDINIKGSIQEYSIEIKTSLLANHTQTLDDQMNNFNMIIQRKHDNIEDDLTRDLYIQILFAIPRADRDEFINKNEPDFKQNIFNMNLNDFYKAFNPIDIANNMYFATWTTKEEIVAYVNSLPPDSCTWSYSYQNINTGGQTEQAMREYWKYPLREAFSPGVLPRYIKETQWERQHRHEQEKKTLRINTQQHSKQIYSL